MRIAPLALISALAALTPTPGWAQAPWEEWGADAPAALPGLEAGQLGASLWLPRSSDPNPLYVAVTGMHAALLKASQPEPQTFVLLEGFFRLAEERALDPAAARLVVGEEELAPTGVGLGDVPVGRSVLPDQDGRGYVRYLLSFPPLQPGWTELRVRLPSASGEGEPLEVTFFRLRERLQQVEADLAAWIAYTQRDDVKICSAIEPYLNCEAYQRFRAHGDRFVAPYLLRELARQTPAWREGVLPRFLVFHVLSQTEWGRAQGIASSGDDQDARRLLRHWRKANAPGLPTVKPRDEVRLD